MQSYENMNGMLNDLVRVNNDRIAGYQKATDEINDLDVDLKGLFEGMIKESEQYNHELTGKIRQQGGTVDNDTSSAGDIYRAWMDVKATFTGGDRKAILASCEYGEDAALKAYRTATDNDDELDEECRKMIESQQQGLKNAHDLIKKYRDAHDAVQS